MKIDIINDNKIVKVLNKGPNKRPKYLPKTPERIKPNNGNNIISKYIN